MTKSKRTLSPKLQVKKPVSALFKPVKADFKGLFKALAKGVGHTATGKWIELGSDASQEINATFCLLPSHVDRNIAKISDDSSTSRILRPNLLQHEDGYSRPGLAFPSRSLSTRVQRLVSRRN
jgi:hypothetical protein